MRNQHIIIIIDSRFTRAFRDFADSFDGILLRQVVVDNAFALNPFSWVQVNILLDLRCIDYFTENVRFVRKSFVLHPYYNHYEMNEVYLL